MLLMVGVRRRPWASFCCSRSYLCSHLSGEMVWASLHDYQREQVMAFVDPDYDPGGKTTMRCNRESPSAQGNCRGKGLYGGTQSQLKFLPEGHTDFVFAVYAENGVLSAYWSCWPCLSR